jgi:cysteinyl-tRNA synthetase
MTHYREPIDFSVKRLEEAENIIAKLARRVLEADNGAPLAFVSSLMDDVNSSEFISKLNSLSGKPLSDALDLLGVAFSKVEANLDDAAINAAIDERLAYFADKNFAEADRIRDELLGQGIQLKDGKDPETGERVTTWEVKR